MYNIILECEELRIMISIIGSNKLLDNIINLRGTETGVPIF